ncbi:glutamine amidotransferase-like class 1 domain-containing protein 1 [Acanthaster planci]|uniref:Glutamine amidotransferase-like class 1 domain-containing protein 1 n=1 Tax=Acanthaster planci TaxID=133434 RepID=A0A8B7XTR1_ACAPL|nr:glutamine amidotransferase-like class 1 domain-containing protein 1 [Acanthaster planci]
MAAPGKSSCLLVVSSKEGIPAQSFIHAFTLCHSAFNLQLASPDRKPLDFIEQDESSKRWLNEFKTKPFSTPVRLDTIDASRYSALLLVDSPGALHDLAHDQDLAQILRHFKAEAKPVCAIGMGVAALISDRESSQPGAKWAYCGYSLTAPSVYELARSPTFSSLPIIPEDFIKDNGATYSASEVDAVHVVVDRHLITGQNEASTLTAVQNLILLCNAKSSKGALK